MKLSSIPVAPSIDSSISGEETAIFAASAARFSPEAAPTPIIAEPASDITARTSAKSRLIWPGVVIRSVMPWTPWRRMSSAIRNASLTEVWRSTTWSSFSFGTMIRVSHLARSLSIPSSACCMRRLPSNSNGLVTTPTVSAPISSLAISAITGAAPGARAAALAGGDEDHVGALQRLLDVVAALGRGAAADLRVGARAEPLGELVADRKLDVRLAGLQRLDVGVDGDELDALEASVDHAADRVRAAAAGADDLDHCEVRGLDH